MPVGDESKSRITATDLALIAVFAALIAVSSVAVALPIGILGVPITLQTFAILLTGAILGSVRGFLSVSLYLLVGFPVFAGGMAGVAPFLGVTAGYLLAFPFAAAIIGIAGTRFHNRKPKVMFAALLAFGLLAILLVTLSGSVSIAIVGNLSYGQALLAALIYVPGDLIKLVIAAIVASSVHRAFPSLLSKRKS